jgi:hypothetical protein
MTKTRICSELCLESQIAFCQNQYYNSFLGNAMIHTSKQKTVFPNLTSFGPSP